MTHSLVTGGAGFIGSHLVDALVARGDRVSVLDNLSSGSLDFLAGSRDAIEFHRLDLLDDGFDAMLDGIDVVWHLSANPEVRIGITEPEVMFRQNVDATRRVIEAMARCGVRDLVFTSTSTVYGEASVVPTPEEYKPLAPISAYGQSKLEAEQLIERFCAMESGRGISFRFANCVGPRSIHGVTFDFFHKLRADSGALEILGDGKQFKSYFHIADCIAGMLAVSPAEACPDGGFAALNVGSEDGIDVVTVADAVCEALGLANVEYSFTGGVDGGRDWKGDVKRMLLVVEKLKGFGWEPQFGSRAAICDTAQWLDENY